MAEKQPMGVSLKSPTVVIVDEVVGWTHLASKFSIGVDQKVIAGAQWVQTDSPGKDAMGVSLKAPTVITSCPDHPSKYGMAVRLHGPLTAIEQTALVTLGPTTRHIGVSLKTPTVVIT